MGNMRNLILLLTISLTCMFVTSSLIDVHHQQDAILVLKNISSAHVLDRTNGLAIPQDSLKPRPRSKRWVLTAITVGAFAVNLFVSHKQRALARKAAEQAARNYREQNELKLLQICSSICVTEWSTWSFCSKPCGGGVTKRNRTLQSIGVCSDLKNFECPYKDQQEQNTVCNYGCANGGDIADGGCACKKGFKGRCCQEESVCPYPGKPRQGSIEAPPDGFPGNYREVLHYTCKEGFTLVGDDYAICQANGTWSRHPPRCELIQCFPEGPRANVQILNSKAAYSFGESIYYRCTDGYKLIGEKSRKCEKNLDGSGRWTGYNPLCEAIKCSDPSYPINGRRQGNDLRFGKQLVFSCNQGFTLIGSEVITCSSTGQWIGNIPKCEQIVCEAPFVPRNGEVRVSSHRFGSNADFSCLPGYRLKGPSSLFCEEGGAWNDTEPVCDAAICKDPGIPENGYKDGTIYFYPHNVSFGCFQGFEMIGDEEITCLESGVWSGARPQCLACGFATYMESGSCKNCPTDSNTTTVASTSRHQCLCKSGYTGPPGGPCEEINCEKLGAPPFGQISQCDTKLGSRCKFTCNTGHVLERGSSERVCRDPGDWDGSNPLCSPCPLNTYKSSEVQCTPCPANSHTEDLANTLDGCTCDEGYEGPPGGPCEDVDECLPNGGKGPCEDTCENAIGTYTCRCTIPGYALDVDEHKCKVEKECTNLTETEAPANGGLVCHWFTQQNAQHCQAKCDPGYDFPARINNYELCGPTTGFQWTFRQEDPEAKFEPCIEEFFPGIRLEADSSYFVRRCKDLTEEEQKAVKEQFAEVLNGEGICKDRRANPLCQIKDIAIICGLSERRRKRRGVNDDEESINFSFNVTALKFDVSTEHCPDICRRMRIPTRYCDQYCIPSYKRYLKAAVLYAKRQLSAAFNNYNKNKMNFNAANRNFEAEGASTSGLIVECDPGMRSKNQQCIPCFPGTYYSPRVNDCLLCANGTYQPLFSQEDCFTCPDGTYTPKPGEATCHVCAKNTWGPECRYQCDCVNGQCNTSDGTCICYSGWEGQRCDQDIPGCERGQCYPGVACEDVPAPGIGFKCGPCPSGFSGDGITCHRI